MRSRRTCSLMVEPGGRTLLQVMNDSSIRTTIFTHPSSSPLPSLLGPNVMSILGMQARMTGANACDILIHAMLLGIGLAGTRLTWKLREPKSPPQFGRCSAAFALQEDECPWWLRLSLNGPISLQKRVNELSRQEFLKQPSAAQVRQERDRSKMLRPWLPQTPGTILMAATSHRHPHNVDFLLNLPARGWFKQTNSVYGSDRLLLLRGTKDYERLIKHREIPPFLLEIESGGNAWPRVTFHGWLNHDALIRYARKLDADSLGRLGWLVPVSSGKPQGEADPDQDPVIDELFHKMVMLRLGKAYCFSPPPEIAARIEVASNDLRTLLASQPVHLHPLGLHDDQLVWQLATLLANLANRQRDKLFDHELHEVVDAAAAIAGRIAAAHLNVLRQVLPSGRSADALARPIVDRVVKGPATIRDLVRTFHKIPTAEVELSLLRLEHDGMVARIEGGRWAFVRVPLPDLSAVLSESVAKPR